METYIQVKTNLFFKIENTDNGGLITSINTATQTIRINKCFPTAYSQDFKLITKEEYEKVKNKIITNQN